MYIALEDPWGNYLGMFWAAIVGDPYATKDGVVYWKTGLKTGPVKDEVDGITRELPIYKAKP